MGVCASNPSQHRDSTITRQLTHDATIAESYHKLLLLGAGECGKSTILKQMKILHADGFSEEEKNETIPIIRKNILDIMKSLVNACIKLNIPYDNKSSYDAAQTITGLYELDTAAILDPVILSSFDTLYTDGAIKQAIERRNEFTLLDSAVYFLQHLTRICTVDYIPINDDILRARIATTGIHEMNFTCDGHAFKMFDVGGQRGERKKWIHCFECISEETEVLTCIPNQQNNTYTIKSIPASDVTLDTILLDYQHKPVSIKAIHTCPTRSVAPLYNIYDNTKQLLYRCTANHTLCLIYTGVPTVIDCTTSMISVQYITRTLQMKSITKHIHDPTSTTTNSIISRSNIIYPTHTAALHAIISDLSQSSQHTFMRPNTLFTISTIEYLQLSSFITQSCYHYTIQSSHNHLFNSFPSSTFNSFYSVPTKSCLASTPSFTLSSDFSSFFPSDTSFLHTLASTFSKPFPSNIDTLIPFSIIAPTYSTPSTPYVGIELADNTHQYLLHSRILTGNCVDAILFIASLSEYDQVLIEDATTNRLVESLQIFEGIVNLPWFQETPIILFLNKNDVSTFCILLLYIYYFPLFLLHSF